MATSLLKVHVSIVRSAQCRSVLSAPKRRFSERRLKIETVQPSETQVQHPSRGSKGRRLASRDHPAGGLVHTTGSLSHAVGIPYYGIIVSGYALIYIAC